MSHDNHGLIWTKGNGRGFNTFFEIYSIIIVDFEFSIK